MAKKGKKKAMEPAELDRKEKLKSAAFEKKLDNQELERRVGELHAAKVLEQELRETLGETREQLVESKELTRDVTADLARNHRRSIEVLEEKMRSIMAENEHLTDVVRQKDELIGELEDKLAAEQADKLDQVNKLKAKIEAMANHFSDLLRETLDRMGERLERWDEGHEVEQAVPQAA